MTDVRLEPSGSFVMIQPLTAAAVTWLDEYADASPGNGKAEPWPSTPYGGRPRGGNGLRGPGGGRVRRPHGAPGQHTGDRPP